MSSNLTLEQFVNSIRNLYASNSSSGPSGESSNLRANVNYAEVFTTINSNLEALTENATNLIDNVLPVFVLPEYTLPNMAVLYSVVSQLQQQTQPPPNVNIEKLLDEIESCIRLADERQISVASDIFSELCHFYTNKLCASERPKRGLLPIFAAIGKIQLDVNTGKCRENQLTSVHADLLQLSLASKNFTLAHQLISREILDIHKPSAKSTFDAKYLLAYFYYAGCIYAALKDYDEALFHFEQALTLPAHAFSQIMIESYKKFILVSLISKAKIAALPKYTSRLVINQIRQVCSIYHEVASAYTVCDSERLTSLCAKYTDVFAQDKNAGLVKQLQQSFYKRSIQTLTKTFITLSLADMAHKVKLPSAKHAEKLMLDMIRNGEIFATISQKDGMVSFHDNPEKYDNPIIMEQLKSQMLKCVQMDASIKEMDKEITTHPHYIQKCQTSTMSGTDEAIDQLLQ